MTNQDNRTDNNFGRRATRIAMWVLASIILGAIGSGIWDILFKPGISSAGQFITGLSSYLDDAVFTTAALNPLPIPSLIIIILLSMIPLLGCMVFLDIGFIRIPLENFMRKKFAKKNENEEEYTKRNVRILRFVASFGLIFSILIFFAVKTSITVLNEATLVWRQFYRNIEISAPYMTSDEYIKTIALFRSMKTRNDFVHIQNKLNAIAASHNTTIEWYNKKK